jgi:nucleolar protein 56
LGAEKALFRALKTKGNTPKYGLIYHSTFIGRAGQRNKGRISRFLANKCTIASRIDCFSDTPTTKFGEALRKQVEERLDFYEKGTPASKNADVMQAVMQELAQAQPEDTKKTKKRTVDEAEKPKKKKKKTKEEEPKKKKK